MEHKLLSAEFHTQLSFSLAELAQLLSSKVIHFRASQNTFMYIHHVRSVTLILRVPVITPEPDKSTEISHGLNKDISFQETVSSGTL